MLKYLTHKFLHVDLCILCATKVVLQKKPHFLLGVNRQDSMLKKALHNILHIEMQQTWQSWASKEAV
jgi:hypothetical protein